MELTEGEWVTVDILGHPTPTLFPSMTTTCLFIIHENVCVGAYIMHGCIHNASVFQDVCVYLCIYRIDVDFLCVCVHPGDA